WLSHSNHKKQLLLQASFYTGTILDRLMSPSFSSIVLLYAITSCLTTEFFLDRIISRVFNWNPSMVSYFSSIFNLIVWPFVIILSIQIYSIGLQLDLIQIGNSELLVIAIVPFFFLIVHRSLVTRFEIFASRYLLTV